MALTSKIFAHINQLFHENKQELKRISDNKRDRKNHAQKTGIYPCLVHLRIEVESSIPVG